jgi:hypothetical protein
MSGRSSLPFPAIAGLCSRFLKQQARNKLAA